MTLPDDRPAVTRVGEAEVEAAAKVMYDDNPNYEEGFAEDGPKIEWEELDQRIRDLYCQLATAALEAAAQARSGQEGEVERLQRQIEHLTESRNRYATLYGEAEKGRHATTDRATKAEECVKALEGAAFSAMAAIGEARGFVAYCSKGDSLDHWLIEAQSALAALLVDLVTDTGERP